PGLAGGVNHPALRVVCRGGVPRGRGRAPRGVPCGRGEPHVIASPRRGRGNPSLENHQIASLVTA
ncbi:MAG TPA: hypothetical protein PLS77_14345, partial [Anaerolineaceae bacterium]|nr:hypothetical protein [Anaerolineaceae bacterium]